MATEKKFLRLDTEVLLEWLYNSENLKQNNYKILQNFNTGIRTYISETGNNTYDNTMFPIDDVIRKYAQVDTNKYNFLKLENYSNSIVQYDTVRIHLPSSFSFYDNDHKGLYIRIYTYDFNNNKQYDISNYYYDDTIVESRNQITLSEEFVYDNNIWGKYITFDIPSVEYLSKQRLSNVSPNISTPDSMNSNLTNGVGLSQSSPIFIEFSFISTKNTTLGVTSYRLTSQYTTSINQSPDFEDVGVSIIESAQGDFFEINGIYNNNSEEFDNYIEGLIDKGRGIRLEYVLSLYEENILMNKYTYTITENFAQSIWYRPIISFSNTTALISVELGILDSIDGSKVTRTSSIGLTNNIFKYGKNLSRINIDNAFKPKIYNLKSNNLENNSMVTTSDLQDINLTKVNYPVITDRIKILASSSSSNNDTNDYKSMGLAEIILNPFDNYIKFLIASDVDNNGTATPYNLSGLLENSTLILVFQSDNVVVEKQIFQETDQNNYENGIVIFKITSSDILNIKKISQNNKNFYIVVKSLTNGVKTLLYSGRFVTYDNVKFLDNPITGNVTGFDPNDTTNTTVDFSTGSTTNSNSSVSPVTTNTNAMIFLNLNANISTFESYLSSINANVYVKRAGGNEISGSYFYYILNVSNDIKSDIRRQNGVREVIDVAFDLGKNTNDTQGVNIDQLKDRVTNFNCDNANKNS